MTSLCLSFPHFPVFLHHFPPFLPLLPPFYVLLLYVAPLLFNQEDQQMNKLERKRQQTHQGAPDAPEPSAVMAPSAPTSQPLEMPAEQ